MAFENPLFKPSNVRKSALAYLWSDDKDDMFNINNVDSNSVVGNAFSVQSEADEATNVALNIANNDGSYNPNDTTNYGGSYALSNPVETFNAVNTYGKAALSLLGVPFASAVASGMEQAAANNVIGLVDSFTNQYGGQTTDTMNPVMAGLINVNPVIGSILGKSDSVEAAKGLVDAFETTDAMAGYFSAALDPTISQIAQGVIADPTTVTPAQFGILGQSIATNIQDNVAKGMDLNAAQAAAVDFFNPPTAISMPVSSPAVPIGTPLGPIGSDAPSVSTPSGAISTPVSSPAMPIGTPLGPIGGGGDSSGGGGYNAGDGGYGSGQGGYDAGDMGHGDASSPGGGGGGSSKIVCTAMNESYGFGSFRNRIWLAYAAKHLTKEHEKGYHALFLPLVNLAYRKQTIVSKPLRAVLENIARHRSADLRAEMRGTKRDIVGKVYRAILEPLCYIVGKYN